MSLPKVVIIDRENANINSLKNAILHVKKCNLEVTSDFSKIEKSDYLVLAGVGAFRDGMEDLKNKRIIEVLTEQALVRKKPFLGICLGMQMLFSESFENGKHEGLGLIPGSVRYLDLDKKFRVPHVGWNDISYDVSTKIFKNLGKDKNFYFVHSYHAVCKQDFIIAKADYGMDITAAVQFENILGFQFHPEKSQENGMTLLTNFLSGEYY